MSHPAGPIPPLPFRTERIARIDSSNAEALRRARAGDPGRLWLIAGEQTAGRGRRGRAWVSPPGNLHATLLLCEVGPAPHLHELGFVAALCLAEALQACFGVGVREQIRIKWPNDLLFNGAKVAGILAEAEVMANGTTAVAIGIGVNCQHCPPDAPYPTTTLAATPAGDSIRLFAELHRTMKHWLDIWRADGFDPIRQAWETYGFDKGEMISVNVKDERIKGTYGGIEPDGALRLDTDQGRLILRAGDIYPTAPASPGGAD